MPDIEDQRLAEASATSETRSAADRREASNRHAGLHRGRYLSHRPPAILAGVPAYDLILAHGEGEREHVYYDSGDTDLEIGSQLEVNNTCWQVAADENGSLVCGACLPIIFHFGNREAGLFHADIRRVIPELRAEAAEHPVAAELADGLSTMIDGAEHQVPLDRDRASALRWAIQRLEISDRRLSPDLDHLRITLHRNLEDNPPAQDSSLDA